MLVTLYDGQPVPKVIDFGIAKAVQQRLTDKTMFTEFGQVIGTLGKTREDERPAVSGYETLATHLSFSADSRRMMTAHKDGSIRVYSGSDPIKELSRLQPRNVPIRVLAPSRDGKLLLVSYEDGQTTILSVHGEVLASWQTSDPPVKQAFFSDDAEYVFVVRGDLPDPGEPFDPPKPSDRPPARRIEVRH